MRRVWILVASIVGAAAGCYRAGTFACSDDGSCIDRGRTGVCQPSGFCSYPDASCGSGQRYDDLAGAGLAEQCVEPETAGDGSSSGSFDGDGNATSDGAAPGRDDAMAPDPPNCLDEDGDEYGEGDCLGADCDDDNPLATDDCLYVGTEADADPTGTRDDPFGTFQEAVGALQPGMSLVVLPGVYEPAVHGPLWASCSEGTALSGTPDAPIFVRADEERLAHIKTDGLSVGIEIDGCEHWRVRGLRVSGKDTPGSTEGILVIVRDTNDVQMRRLLVHDDNRFVAAPMIYAPGSEATLFEECEVYAFSTSAFYLSGAANAVIRRSYIHGRNHIDLRPCVDGGSAKQAECTAYAGADHGIVSGHGSLVENTIIEDVAIGVVGTAVAGPTVLGSAMLDGLHGIVFAHDGSAGSPYSRDVTIENVVGVRLASRVVYLRTVTSAVLRNITGAACDGALRSDLDGAEPCSAEEGCTAMGANLLAVDSASTGLSMLDGNAGWVTHSNSIDSTEDNYFPREEVDPIADDTGYWRNSTSEGDTRTATDACLAYVHDDSAMKGRGEAPGEDIGANILYRYVDGALTDAPLWDPQTGAFPCGATAAGVNDDPANSCIGAAARLGVATPACPLPADYP